MKILLIEPDAMLGETYKKALEQAKHMVTHVKAAQDAIYEADRDKPDLVILEVQLPGHSGIEFLYELRSYSEWQDIPVILQTMVPAKTLEAIKTSMLGVVEHLYKPATDLKRLVQAVASAEK